MLKKILFIFMLFFTFSATAQNMPFQLAVFGDSLSAGYGVSKENAFYSKLEVALKNKGYRVQVINASRSGETTSGGVSKLGMLIQKKPNAVLLQLGSNDAIRGVSISTITTNLEKMILQLKEAHISVLLVGMEAPLNQSTAYQQQFRKMYVDLAQKHKLPLYPFFMEGIFPSRNLLALQAPNDRVLGDRVHPSAKGIDIMVANILPIIEKFLKPIYRS